jgi:hypothetical protein
LLCAHQQALARGVQQLQAPRGLVLDARWALKQAWEDAHAVVRTIVGGCC